MKKIVYTIIICLMSQFAYAAGSDDSGSDNNKADFYNEAKKLVKRAGKLEKKEKVHLVIGN